MYWNGDIVKGDSLRVSSGDGGLLYGHGVFETMLVSQGKVVFVEEHLQRLFDSLKKIKIDLQEGPQNLREITGHLVKVNGLVNGSLRLTVTAGDPAQTGKNYNILVSGRHGLRYSPEQYQKGYKVGLSQIRRNQYSPVVYIKSTNYLENILARQEAVQNGWDEILFCNVSGYLTEGSVSNLFIIKNETVLTPAIECGLLPGITRDKVLDIAVDFGYKVRETYLTSYDLLVAGEAFLTNSLMGVMPLVRLGTATVGNGKPGSVTRRIAKDYTHRCLL